MEQDEASTLVALKARRKEVLEPLVHKHHGRIFKITGDGVLVEFASAVNAVRCAVELQQGMASANSDLPASRRIMLRIGVNLGDVLVEGSDLYGGGVNVAARLERLADPGSICVSSSVYDQVKRKLDAVFDELGPQTVKNIVDPVHVYVVRPRSPDRQKGAVPDGEPLPLPVPIALAGAPFLKSRKRPNPAFGV